MKRALNPLVDYDASDDDDDDTKLEKPGPPPKKKKLPALSSSMAVAAPIDNPELHQGRVRTHPHVDGQYATHIYIPLRLKPRSAVYQLLRDVIIDAKNVVPSLQEICEFGNEDSPSKGVELHVSLSRPIYLRAHQREDFKREVMEMSKRQKQFSISLTTFSELINDERTRTFLAVEIGAGHHELKSLTNVLTPILRLLRQKEYYEEPRFHASIAWALLDWNSPGATRAEGTISVPGSSEKFGSDENVLSMPEPNSSSIFPTIPRFPKDLISTLNERYSSALASTKGGLFAAEFITVKIGKEIFSRRLTA
ncbi:hypothetical protein AX15_000085 [Amanita polypyramis BW_CC]|nr:hypothetical protein AX15_000085 [Amanita polypyramis BW_CC]